MFKLLHQKKKANQKWGCGCAIIKNGKILIGKRCKEGDSPQWCFVGGSVEIDETPYDAIKREINEECNLQPNKIDFVSSYEKDGFVDFLFVCTSFYGEIIPQESELSEIRWFSIEDIESVPLFPYTAASIQILRESAIIDRDKWLKSLKPGDKVANRYVENGINRFSSYEIKKITPTGCIRLTNDVLLDKNGSYSKYSYHFSTRYYIEPITKDILEYENNVRKHNKLIKEVSNLLLEKSKTCSQLSIEQLTNIKDFLLND